jgi:hypothetical protein
VDLSRQTSEDLFEQAPPIEPRKWIDHPDEAHDLLNLSPKMHEGRGRVQRYDAWRYGQVLARQTVRRELVALRRRVEEWAATAQADGSLDSLDPLDLMRDMVTVLDERISDRGGIER